MNKFAWLGLILLVAVGCTPSAGTVPVKGKVTLKGAPAPEGTLITFTPVGAGESATGRVKAGGEYELFTGVRGDAGAKPGKYKVVIVGGTPMDQSAYQSMKPQKPGQGAAPGQASGDFPKEYASADTTPLEKEVTSGSNTIDIEVP